MAGRKATFILFFLVLFRYGIAQPDRSSFGIGAAGGYNSIYGDGGVFFQADFFSHFDINGGLATRRYQGAGFSLGWRYYPMGIKKFRPVIGVNMVQINGRKFSVADRRFFSIYSTPMNQYIISSAGLVVPLQQFDVMLLGGYGLARYEVHTVNQSGFPDEVLMQNIDDRINGGWGITLSVIYRPWREYGLSDPEFQRM
jgi:hypothetical protein